MVGSYRVVTTFKQEYRMRGFTAPGATGTRRIPCGFGLEIRGELNPRLLESALTWVARRHSALRVYFPRNLAPRESCCTDPASVTWTLRQVDLKDFPEADRTEAESREILALLDYFDPTEFPLFRGCLTRLNHETWRLGIAVDHLIFDGGSIGIFFTDLELIYHHLAAGRNPGDLVDGGSDYALYCYAEREWANSEAAQRAAEHWRKEWAEVGPRPPSGLPLPRLPREPAGRIWQRPLSATRVAAVQRSFRQGHTSIFALLSSSVLYSMREIAGAADYALMQTTSSRSLPRHAGTIGDMSNIVLLRASAGAPVDWISYCAQARNSVLDTMEYFNVPFYFLIDSIFPGWSRDPSLAPDLSVNFNRIPRPPRLANMVVRFWSPISKELFVNAASITVDLAQIDDDEMMLSAGYESSSLDEAMADELMCRVADRLTIAT